MSVQIIYRPKGINVLRTSIAGAGGANISLIQTFPDAAEHDKGRELVMLHKISLEVEAGALATFYSSVNATTDIRGAFRPGGAFGTAGTLPNAASREKWLSFQLASRNTLAAVTNTVSANMTGEMEFKEPLPIDPTSNTLSGWMKSDVAGAVWDVAGYLVWTLWYSWAKASQEDLQSYLEWEALGV